MNEHELKVVLGTTLVLRRPATTREIFDACFACAQLVPRVDVFNVATATMTREQFDALDDFLTERNATHTTQVKVRNEAKLATYVRDGKTRTFAYHSFSLDVEADAPLELKDARELLACLVPLFANREWGFVWICEYLESSIK